jgi:hypothetical protein
MYREKGVKEALRGAKEFSSRHQTSRSSFIFELTYTYDFGQNMVKTVYFTRHAQAEHK